MGPDSRADEEGVDEQGSLQRDDVQQEAVRANDGVSEGVLRQLGSQPDVGGRAAGEGQALDERGQELRPQRVQGAHSFGERSRSGLCSL